MSQKNQQSIKNRIVGSGMLSPKEIKANAKNWRKHPKTQRDALDGVLKEVGWVQEVIINKTTGCLVDGHLRVSLALERKEKEIPVKYVELTESEEAIVLATIDPIGAMAITDQHMLEQLLAEATAQNEEVENFLLELKYREGLIEQIEDAPSISDLEKEHKISESDFWPKLRLSLPQDTFDLYKSKIAKFAGEEHEKFLKLLEACL